MSEVLERKVGIVSCSGEELAEGTVARLAALKVLNELRPRDTVTICLPLFLAGGAGDRAFAKVHPTITVDGCDLRCAARGTEKYSSKPAAILDNTPLLDIKPYIPEFDAFEAKRIGWCAGVQGGGTVADGRFEARSPG